MGGRSWARSTVKTLTSMALHYSGLRGVLSRASRIAVGGHRVLILSYHRIVDDFVHEARNSIPALLTSQSTFERHIEELARSGFDIVSLADALDVIAGCTARPRDVAVLTFDDGYRDVYDYAFPLLKQKGIPATIYLPTGYVGTSERLYHDRLYHLMLWKFRKEKHLKNVRKTLSSTVAWSAGVSGLVDDLVSSSSLRELKNVTVQLEREVADLTEIKPRSGEILNWAMVRKMADAGISFGAHTVNHVVLTRESDDSVRNELSESKKAIESQIGNRAVDFAYPNGRYDQRVIEAVASHGFHSAVTTEDLFNHIDHDPLRLRRKTLWENFSRGPWGYSSTLTGCHLDSIFTLLAWSKPVLGERKEEKSAE